jgi:enediyne biosynthesis protein E4
MVEMKGSRTLRVIRSRFWLVALAGSVALCAVVAALAQAPGGVGNDVAARTRLLAVQREAVSLLERVARADTPRDEVRRALTVAGQRLDALAAEGDPQAASADRDAPLLAPALRAELRRAARELAAFAAVGADTAASASPAEASRRRAGSQSDSNERIDTGPFLALLERVRAQLEGEIALGLSLQGSYSKTRVKDPAYGGHASAMGPAPVETPSPADDPELVGGSPALFEEAARLPTRTYCGGSTKDHILESGGSGVALLDYDGDGRLDIYLVTAAELTPTRERVPHRNALYRNLGGWKFEDVSKQAGVDAAAWGNGVCAADVDDDGLLDLYVTNWGPNLLFRNRGDGTFEEVAAHTGVAAGGWSTGCTFFDADADGDLDLYVARYVETTWDEVVRAQRTLVWRNGPRIMVGPAGLRGEDDLFFENLGDGRFNEATQNYGLSDQARAYGFGVVATDYDDDGLVDLFVANDSNPNFLYRNLGNRRFESVGLVAGVAVNGEARAQAGMGVDAADYDGDNRMDLVLTAFAHDRNTLYRNIDGRQFEDASAAVGLAGPTFERMGWGAAFLDADLDTKPDLFFVNGHIFADIEDYPQLRETYRQKNQLLLNLGRRFRDVSARAGGGLQVARVGRGLAVGDLDNDGDPDLVVSNMDDVPTLLENRQRTGHHWVTVRVVSPSRNRFAIGARVSIDAGGRKQVREIRSGGSYLSQSDLRASFGLGDYAGPVTVEVRMPGGRRWRWSGLGADRVHALTLSESASVSQTSLVR